MAPPLSNVHWRDCQSWREDGLPLTYTSNEAARILDKSVGQLYSLYEIDREEDGLQTNIKKLELCYPNFALGKAFSCALKLTSQLHNAETNKALAKSIAELRLASKLDETLSTWEKSHVAALHPWSLGFLEEAANQYERILQYHPLDAMALRFSNDIYFQLGRYDMIRNHVLRVLPYWNKTMPLYPYLLSMAALGYEECGRYEESMDLCRRAINMNRHDVWAYHVMAHNYDHQGLPNDGFQYVMSGKDDFEKCGTFASHTLWHTGLFMIEMGDYEGALDLFHSKFGKHAHDPNAALNLTDSVALLKRLEIAGIKINEEHWDDVYELYRPVADDHIWIFNNIHCLIAMSSCKKGHDATHAFMKSLKEYANEPESGYPGCSNRSMSQKYGIQLCDAWLAYQAKDYNAVVNLIYPMRQEIIRIGGSDAQRDLYNYLLLTSCCMSDNMDDQMLGRALLHERKALRNTSSLTDRLQEKMMAHHENGQINGTI